jgi:hypothetical protein
MYIKEGLVDVFVHLVKNQLEIRFQLFWGKSYQASGPVT